MARMLGAQWARLCWCREGSKENKSEARQLRPAITQSRDVRYSLPGLWTRTAASPSAREISLSRLYFLAPSLWSRLVGTTEQSWFDASRDGRFCWFPKASRLALTPTECPIECQGVFPPG